MLVQAELHSNFAVVALEPIYSLSHVGRTYSSYEAFSDVLHTDACVRNCEVSLRIPNALMVPYDQPNMPSLPSLIS